MNRYPSPVEQPTTDPLQIVIFGGGGGGSVMTDGFSHAMPDAHIVAVVPTGDSGGGAEHVRRIWGGPAVGDSRKILGAIASTEAAPLFDDDTARFGPHATADSVRALNDLFLTIIEDRGLSTARPAKMLADVIDHVRELPDGLEGQTYANLVLNALRLHCSGKLTPAIAEMGQWVGARPNVTILPVTEESHNLVMHDKAAKKILVGEGLIDDHAPADPSLVDVWLEAGEMVNREIGDPLEVAAYLERREHTAPPTATTEAIGQISLSDVVILSPGSPYTSHAQLLRAGGVAEALRLQKDKNGLWVFVANLIEERPGLTLDVHMRTVVDAIGRPVTHLVHNTDTDGLPEGKTPINYDPASFNIGDAQAIGEALVSSGAVRHGQHDKIAHLRSPKHHDPWRVVDVFQNRILGQRDSGAKQLVPA